MSTDKNDQEPSMEEILSSIRRIIADDQDEGTEGKKPEAEPAKAKKAKSPAPEPIAEPAEDDVLELTEMVEPSPPKTAEDDQDEGFFADDLDDIELEPEPEPVAPRARPAPAKLAPRESNLVSAPTAAASTSAFARITRAASGGEAKPRAVVDQTLETFLTELLRPMLKDWLDRNLESIVERVVEEEVKKLARRAELM